MKPGILCIILFFTTFMCVNTQRFKPVDMLNLHNFYRCQHGVPPLIYDNNLAASAQEWAFNRGQHSCALAHSGTSGLGENTASGNWFSEDDVVSAWYHEDWVYGSSSISFNHFSQVIWKGTTHVGCAWVTCGGGNDYWLCQYTPAGNIMDAGIINANVPPPCRTWQQCLFAVRSIDLNTKFSSTSITNAAKLPNAIDVSTYNYAAQTCGTPVSAYPVNTVVICPTNSSTGSLPNDIDITITNPSSTGPLSATRGCIAGMDLSGSNSITCTAAGTWSLGGTCVPGAPTPPPPPPPPRCWSTQMAGYIFQYPDGYVATPRTLQDAKTLCATKSDCGGVTSSTINGWELRRGPGLNAVNSGEFSYLLDSQYCGANPPSGPTSTPPPPPPPSPPPPPATNGITRVGSKCFGPILPNTYLFLYPDGYSPPDSATLLDAQTACGQFPDCGGVTQVSSTLWEARAGSDPMDSSSGENSQLVVDCPAIQPVDVKITLTALKLDPTLKVYLMGPKIKRLRFKVTPSVLSDGQFSGTFGIKDTIPADSTVTATSLSTSVDTAGFANFDIAYGPKKAGIHKIVAKFNGNDFFNAATVTFNVLYFMGPPTGHFVLPTSKASVGKQVYYYGPDWVTNNGILGVTGFIGAINDNNTIASPICTTPFVGLNNNPTTNYNLGQYIYSYVTDTLITQPNGKYKGAIRNIAIIKLANTGARIVNSTNPGVGTVYGIICPKAGSI